MTGPRFSFRLPTEPLEHLTSGDWDVLHLMALGMSDKMIGAVRGNKRETVKNRFYSIHQKLGTGNRIGMLRAVGWLRVPPEDGPVSPRRWVAA